MSRRKVAPPKKLAFDEATYNNAPTLHRVHKEKCYVPRATRAAGMAPHHRMLVHVQLQRVTNPRKQLDENYAVAKSLDIVGTPAFLFAKTTWGKKGLSASGATLVRGAMNMTDFKKLIVSIRLNN